MSIDPHHAQARAEMEGRSSIYWVISGVIRCRQPSLRLAEAL